MRLKSFIILFLNIFLFSGIVFAKKSRLKKHNTSIRSFDTNTIFQRNKERKDSDFKYVVFDISNCFWQPSLYDILMSLKKHVKISFKGYLDFLQCGVSYAFGNLDAKKGYETFFKYLKKLRKDEVEAKCKLVWDKNCKNYIYQDAFDRFEKHKQDGLITIMVDAGITPLYKEFSNLYKFDYLFCSHLEFKDGLVTGKLLGEPCSGVHKYNMIKKLIEKDLGGSLDDVIFYANSANDIPLLEKVGRPIAVNPNTKLRHRANKDGWPILHFIKLKD